METLPKTYKNKDEESLRDYIRGALNQHIQGDATGETYNFQGKADILVRRNNKNEFIGECKFWKGETEYLRALSQLLSYLSWGDTNTALILFLGNSYFSKILDKIK